MRRALACVVLVAACHDAQLDRPDDVAGSSPLVVSGLEPHLPWGSEWADVHVAGPELVGQELVRGEEHTIEVVGAPPGSEILFFASDSGTGVRHCLPGTTICSELLDPWEYGRKTADDSGSAKLRKAVPKNEIPREIYFQALVIPPGGDPKFSSVILRHVSVAAHESATQLVKVTTLSGLEETTTLGNSHTGGAAWVDYNGDLWPDLFITNGAFLPHELYRNNGDGSFTRVSELVRKPALATEDAGVAFADIDNDGDEDILVAADSGAPLSPENTQDPAGGPNMLYLNEGDGTFVESAEVLGLLDPDGHRNICATFADIDRDGLVDVHLGEWAMNTLPEGTLDNFDHTLLNVGGGFVHATDELGTDGHGRDALACMFFDANRDGWPDLYLGHVNNVLGYDGSNPEADDVLYLNEGGTFRDATADSPGVGDDAWSAMGITVGDLDNDGDFDLYVTDRFDLAQSPFPRGNVLYLNNGDGTFEDNSCQDARVCGGYTSWPTHFADFDRDGWVDLFVGTTNPGAPNLLFVNNRDGTFASHEQNALDGLVGTRGSAVADYDGDGDVDIFVTVYPGSSHLFRNESLGGNWLELQLVGTTSNRDAIGAEIELTAGGLVQLRQITGGDSAHSQSERIVHFGLGLRETIDRVQITWPSGLVQVLEDVAPNELWIVDEDEGLVAETIAATATWSGGLLELSATTSYGGRTSLEVVGHGALGWDPEALAFTGELAFDTPPVDVTITGRRGGEIVVPVEILP